MKYKRFINKDNIIFIIGTSMVVFIILGRNLAPLIYMVIFIIHLILFLLLIIYNI